VNEIEYGDYCWDAGKERFNRLKHGVGFLTAAKAFDDPGRRIIVDERHSQSEPRWFCLGAGYWRKARGYYEKEN